jgi:hypothetical protein
MSEVLPPILLALHASRRLVVALVVVYGGSGVIVLALDLPAVVKLLVVLAVAAGLVRAICHHVLHRGDAIAQARLCDDGGWQLVSGDDARAQAQLLPSSVVLPSLAVLAFRLEDGRRRHLLLTADNVDPAAFRRLRVRLRSAALPEDT